jgi:hypothetical protein
MIHFEALIFFPLVCHEFEFIHVQKEEERQKQVERRKKERLKTVNKRRSLETLVKDAKKRADNFEKQVSSLA